MWLFNIIFLRDLLVIELFLQPLLVSLGKVLGKRVNVLGKRTTSWARNSTSLPKSFSRGLFWLLFVLGKSSKAIWVFLMKLTWMTRSHLWCDSLKEWACS